VDRKHKNAKWLNAKFLKRKSEPKDFVLQAEERKRTIRTLRLKLSPVTKLYYRETTASLLTSV
jgi:hypothetical protein